MRPTLFPWWLKLTLFSLLAYAPFMSYRVLRMVGDEKTYLAQILEMKEVGNWFLQTYAYEPSYYKGPLHFLFLRIGIELFGVNMWASVYMNLFLVILSSLALGLLFRDSFLKHPNIKSNLDEWSIWTGGLFSLSLGVWAYSFASQMEIEVTALYTIAIYFLFHSSRRKESLYLFWIMTAISGWAKSPLHSALLGISAPLFWLLEGSIKKLVKNVHFWIAGLLGVIIGALGYLPALMLDSSHFIKSYLMRETVERASNSGSPFEALVALLTFLVFPWTFLFLFFFLKSFFHGIRTLKSQSKISFSSSQTRLIKLSLSVLLPSILFFAIYHYRGQNYNLPVIGAFVLLMASLSVDIQIEKSKVGKFLCMMIGSLPILFATIATWIKWNFQPMPDWWPIWFLPGVYICTILSTLSFFFFMRKLNPIKWTSLLFSVLMFYFSLGLTASIFGERELVDLKKFSNSDQFKEHPYLYYYNLDKNIWNEWGLISFGLGRSVFPIHSEDQLKEKLIENSFILVSKERQLEHIQRMLKNTKTNRQLSVTPWKRWEIPHRRDTSGKTALFRAWESQTFDPMEQNYYIVYLSPKSQ